MAKAALSSGQRLVGENTLLLFGLQMAQILYFRGDLAGATAIVEGELKKVKKFQCMAILHEDRFPGMQDGKRDYGMQIEIRCWDSVDARTAKPVWLAPRIQTRLANRMTKEIPGIVSVTYNITRKPPSTMEAV